MYALVIGLFHPFDVENFHRAKDFVYNNLVRFYSVRAVVEGLDTFDTMKGKNFIIVANHQSSLDMFPLLKATPHRTTFLAKKELLFAPLFGVAAWLYGVVFINRAHSKSARGVMDQTAERISEKKINVWIFPEGTRSQSGTLLPFKKGAFHLAQQTQLPIVPIVIYDYSSIFNKKSKTFDSGVIKGKVLAPLSTEGTTADDVSKLAENVRQVMLKVFHEQDHLDKERNDASSSNDKKMM